MGNGEEYNLDWERESFSDSLFLLEKQMEIEQEWENSEKEATIRIGSPNKNTKFAYGTIKKPRFIQYRNRRVSKLNKEWY